MKNGGINCVGYVLEYVGDIYWKVQLTKNHILNLKKSRFDRDKGTYHYHDNNGSTSCVIKYYWMIRILIYKSGHGNLTLNGPAHRTDNDSISILHIS